MRNALIESGQLIDLRLPGISQLVEKFANLCTGNGPSGRAYRMRSLPRSDFWLDRSLWCRAFQPNQNNPPIPLRLDFDDIAFSNPGLLTSFGRDDHLASPINRRMHPGKFNVSIAYVKAFGSP